MKRIVLHIALLLMVALQVSAQILSPMGNGLPAAPDKIIEYQSGIAVAYSDRDNNIDVQIWNGDFWNTTTRPDLPKTTLPIRGHHHIIDLLSIDKDIYLVAGYDKKPLGETNHILKWDGSVWTDISTDLISNSISIDKLLIENGTLKCLGKFKTLLEEYNVVKYLNGVWVAEGNLITTNLENDKFSSFAYDGNKMLATGRFTNPAASSVSLVEWNGQNWKATDFPPFLGKNISLGNFNDNIVVYGTSRFDDESVKINVNGNWQNMSVGLEDYNVENISQFAQIDQKLFAVGKFINTTTNETSNMMVYDGDSWKETSLNLSSIEQVYSLENKVFVSGDFSDNARINGIGTIYNDRAQITARVYNDKNGNCLKEENEEWLSYYPIHLGEKNTSFYTGIEGQLYLPVIKDNHTLNAAKHNYYEPTCPDIQLNVDEYRTYYGSAVGVKQRANVTDAVLTLTDVNSLNANLNERKEGQLCIDNIGSRFISNATLSLKLEKGITDFQTSVPYDSYQNDIVSWTIDLDANKSNCISISYLITDMDHMSLEANISMAEGVKDEDVSDNTSTLKYKTGASPSNYKYCANGKVIDPGTDFLTYKIGFTNITPKTATSVRVVDLLDERISISKKGLVYNTSHNSSAHTVVDLILNSDGEYQHKIITTLSDVSIPGQMSDEEGSKGFVDYHINVAPLNDGEKICNSAKVYFGFDDGSINEPFYTNEVCSTVGEMLGVDKNETGNTKNPTILNDLTIGPNPVQDHIHFVNNSTHNFHMDIVNSLGQKVHSVEVSKSETIDFEVSNLPNGVYFIYANGIFAKKFVLNQ
ncbi:MAG: DUF7619 domain-containing protein [Bacteroidia bacterium]